MDTIREDINYEINMLDLYMNQSRFTKSQFFTCTLSNLNYYNYKRIIRVFNYDIYDAIFTASKYNDYGSIFIFNVSDCNP